MRHHSALLFPSECYQLNKIRGPKARFARSFVTPIFSNIGRWAQDPLIIARHYLVLSETRVIAYASRRFHVVCPRPLLTLTIMFASILTCIPLLDTPYVYHGYCSAFSPNDTNRDTTTSSREIRPLPVTAHRAPPMMEAQHLTRLAREAWYPKAAHKSPAAERVRLGSGI